LIRFSCAKYNEDHEKNLFEAINDILFDDEKYNFRSKQWPQSWRDVRNTLMNHLTKNSNTYITKKEYDNICKVLGLSLDEGATILAGCNTKGMVFSPIAKNSNSSIDWIMHPYWITEGINCLFGLYRAVSYDAKNIYSHMEKQKKHSYSRDETNAILNMLAEKELVFKHKSGKIFIPALLPNNLPDDFPKDDYSKWNLPKDGKGKNSEIRFRYLFLHPIVKQVFMVKLYMDNKEPILYNYGACWYHKDNQNDKGVRIIMMEEANELAFYLQDENNRQANTNPYENLCAAQKWIQHEMEILHKENKIQNCTLFHMFRTIDKKNDNTEELCSDEYSNDDLKTLFAMGDDTITLPKIHRKLSIAEILKGWNPPQTKKGPSVTTNIQCENFVNQTGDKSVGINKGIIYNESTLYSELQVFLKDFLEAQKKSPDASVKKEEIARIEDIINTQEPKEGKKKLIELITPYLPIVNTGATVTNLLMTLANFSSAHPDMWAGVKTLFSFLT
jgi:hypothetical protein